MREPPPAAGAGSVASCSQGSATEEHYPRHRQQRSNRKTEVPTPTSTVTRLAVWCCHSPSLLTEVGSLSTGVSAAFSAQSVLDNKLELSCGEFWVLPAFLFGACKPAPSWNSLYMFCASQAVFATFPEKMPFSALVRRSFKWKPHCAMMKLTGGPRQPLLSLSPHVNLQTCPGQFGPKMFWLSTCRCSPPFSTTSVAEGCDNNVAEKLYSSSLLRIEEYPVWTAHYNIHHMPDAPMFWCAYSQPPLTTCPPKHMPEVDHITHHVAVQGSSSFPDPSTAMWVRLWTQPACSSFCPHSTLVWNRKWVFCCH